MAISHRLVPSPRLVHPDASRDPPASRPLRVCVLVQVRNFAVLRRQLGTADAGALMRRMLRRVEVALPGAAVALVGRDCIEVMLESGIPDALAHTLAASRQTCAAPEVIHGVVYDIDLLLGGAIADLDGDAVVLIEEAEAALGEARSGRPMVMPAHHGGVADAAQMAEAIDGALDRDELVLHYQPKLHVRRQEISSIEALVRWNHPQRGLVPPGDFIPSVERAGRMERLTLWTIARAIADQRRLRAMGHDLRVFINISGQLLADAAFARAVSDLMLAAPDARIGFELTETSVIGDPEGAIAHLQQFDRLGIRVSIDDYGAGLSSLAYLKQLPARELKIDKLFITQLTSSNRDPLIVRSTIDLAHALDMEVVAEGVETHAALALLGVMGCDMVQGYLISRPVTLDALAIFLAEERIQCDPERTRASFTRLAAAWRRA